ncbi:MAG TPA: hypothetical protein VEL28_18660 [Candidatus Binatia bacterium]|nr:hypothetical protein [Candidatus Binatia bacterium]
MRHHTTISVMTAALLTILTASAPPAHAGKSHLLQKAERHVVLHYTAAAGATECPDAGYGFVEVPADGSNNPAAFVVPDGYALVVTDVDWSVRGDLLANHSVYFQLYLRPSFNRVFHTGAQIDSNMAATDLWRGTHSMTSGFRMLPGATLCPSSYRETLSSSAVLDISQVILRGYLIKSK